MGGYCGTKRNGTKRDERKRGGEGGKLAYTCFKSNDLLGLEGTL